MFLICTMEALIPCSILESNDIIVLRSYVSYMYRVGYK